MTIFHDLQHYVAMPRLSGLALSPDGTRLVTTVATLDRAGTGYASALWEVDPAGKHAARRLTRSAKGEAGAAFTSTGDLYFTSTRPDPDADDDTAQAALWQLPADGGEARVVLTRPGGVGSVACASADERTLVVAGLMPGAQDEQAHAALSKAREDAGVNAILHDGYPIRFWDHDLGPETPQVFVVEPDPDRDTGRVDDAPRTVDHHDPLRLRLVTAGLPAPLHEPAPVLSPDGTFALLDVPVPEARAEQRSSVVRIDLPSGKRTTLLEREGVDYAAGPISPDGTRAVVVTDAKSTPDQPPHPQLSVLDLSSGALTPLANDWDRWASPQDWSPDGTGLLVLADDDGRCPVFHIDVTTGAVTQVTHDDAAYSQVLVAPDGALAYGVRSSYAFPAEVVRIDLSTGEVTTLPGPVERPELPGVLEEVETQASDGVRVRGWLARPDSSEAAPMLLWIHGGPLGSWNAWTWRWNPWLMVAQGYAVLLPDPALSTGYGQDFIKRGWGRWGQEPYTDLMALTDAVEQRPDIDETRTAAMGGSFGGYMANWVAGHTDRFDAIVTHASLWELEGFGPTTDAAFYWQREMTPEMSAQNSPHRFVEQIVTPMLVVHGDKDYRVPIGEGLRLWYELLATSGLPADADGSTQHRFLYFPQENHWILSPQHAKVWYDVVSGFLAEHVLGERRGQLPTVLGRTAPNPQQLKAVAAADEDATAAREQGAEAAGA